MKFAIGSVVVDLIDEDDRVVMHINAGHGFEADSLAIWAELCAPGGTVLDIGAYAGLFAIAAALYGCDVYAFEPMPLNAERCRANFARNDVAVDLTEAAVSDTIGTVKIRYSHLVRGLTSGASLLRKIGHSHSVPMLTIDSLNLPAVTAIKIDVERNEPAVLRGAAETIARCKPSILVEVLDDERKAGVLDALPGYRVAREIDVRNWLMVPV